MKKHRKLTDAMSDKSLSKEWKAELEQMIQDILKEGGIKDTPSHREIILQGYWTALLRKAENSDIISKERIIALRAKLDQEIAETNERFEEDNGYRSHGTPDRSN